MSPNQRFPFHAAVARLPGASPNRHLSPHCNPRCVSKNEQSRGFPKQSNSFLASFAALVSSSDNAVLLAERTVSDPLSANTTQGRLRCPQHLLAHGKFTPQNRFNPASYPAMSLKAKTSSEHFRAQEQVSTAKGSLFTCHCKPPLSLNSQHQPPTGRRKQAPETSSMCPSTDF